jgi:hypothetical protein
MDALAEAPAYLSRKRLIWSIVTPRCTSLVTICACEVPAAFSSITNCIISESVIDDCAMANNGIKAANTNIDRSFFTTFLNYDL